MHSPYTNYKHRYDLFLIVRNMWKSWNSTIKTISLRPHKIYIPLLEIQNKKEDKM